MAETMNQENERHGLSRYYLVVGLKTLPYTGSTNHMYSVHLVEPAELASQETLVTPDEAPPWEQLELFHSEF